MKIVASTPLTVPDRTTPVDAKAPAAAPTEAPGDRADVGGGDDLSLLPGMPYALARVSAEEAATAAGRASITERLIAEMTPYPSITAVIAMLPPQDGQTNLVVVSRDGAIEGSEIGGAWRVMRDLCSSPSIKAEAAAHPTAFQTAAPFDANGSAVTIRIPGEATEASLTQALAEGGRPNQEAQLEALIKGLPKGQRVAVLMAGPSAAGKSTLASQIRKFAGDRHVAEFPGDMYFRDADDPQLPKTPTGGVYWDNPEAMHFDEMADAIARLVKDGSADIPVYDFGGVRPGGWNRPDVTGKGLRTEKVTPLALGGDDILVIDSLHAANPKVIDKLSALDLPHAAVYLDAQQAEDRLVRRMVRDFDSRGRSPQQTLADWDMTTFPGEVHFVRPTLLSLDPAQDLTYTNVIANDMQLSREEINHKVTMLDQYGLAPTYPALKTPDEGLAAFSVAEEARLRAIAGDAGASEADRAKALAAADRIAHARG